MAGKDFCTVWTFYLTIKWVSFKLGQQRSKQLATLFKDERCQQLPSFNILEKMSAIHLTWWFFILHRYLERIIQPSELEDFAILLAPHQKATTGDGNVLCKSMARDNSIKYRVSHMKCSIVYHHCQLPSLLFLLWVSFATVTFGIAFALIAIIIKNGDDLWQLHLSNLMPLSYHLP